MAVEKAAHPSTAAVSDGNDGIDMPIFTRDAFPSSPQFQKLQLKGDPYTKKDQDIS